MTRFPIILLGKIVGTADEWDEAGGDNAVQFYNFEPGVGYDGPTHENKLIVFDLTNGLVRTVDDDGEDVETKKLWASIKGCTDNE